MWPIFEVQGSLFVDWLSHGLVGAFAAIAGVLTHRAWVRRRWHPVPEGIVTEAVLAADLVNSTWLANHHGEEVAMRARNLLERRAREAASAYGVTSIEITGDGSMMTFPATRDAALTVVSLLRGLRDRPPDLSPAPPLQIRAAITYGQILIDAKGNRHGATINEAFRLMGIAKDAFVAVEGEPALAQIPDRDRIFLDEDAVREMTSGSFAIQQVGVCRLKGFTGLHRVYMLGWQ